MNDKQSTATLDPAPVTVLVPTFNRAHFLGQALESLFRQDPPPAEVIVIDDGSDDETAAVVSRFMPRLTYLHQVNSGKATALNHGLDHATQPFIWIFDDDDIAATGTLAALYGALVDKDHAGYSYGLCDKFSGDWPATDRERNLAYQTDDHQALYIRLMEDFFLWQGAMLVRRTCFDAVGPFDTRLARSQDYEMALRLVRAFPGIAVPIIAFHQRHHDGMRGPKKAQISARKVEAAWREFNHLIFRRVYETHELSEYYVGCGNAITRRQTMTALIQRGCIMSRKGLWALARDDFAMASVIAQDEGVSNLDEQEKAALRRVFQGGARSDFESTGQARDFFAVIARFPPELRGAIKGNLMLPLTYRLRRAASASFPLRELHQLWMAGRHMMGRMVLDHYLDARRTDRGMFRVRPLIAN